MKDKVSIHIRIRTPDGKYPFVKPAWSKGKLKPLYAVGNGAEEHHPEAIYYLRYRVGKDRSFEQVGQDTGLLLATKMRREAALLDGTITKPERKTSLPAPTAIQPSTTVNGRHPLLQSIRKYLTEKKAHRSHKTYLAYSATWQMFLEFATLPEFKNKLSFDDYTLREDVSKELTPVAPTHLSIRTVEDITCDCVLNFNLHGERT